MVATQFAHARAGAAAIVLMFLLLLVPTSAQAQAVGDVGAEQGSLYWRQTNYHGGARNTTFIDNGTGESTLHVPVLNRGGQLTNVPVYFYFKDKHGAGPVSHRSGCFRIDTLPAGNPDEPTETIVPFTFNTRELAPGGYNVTVEIMPAAKPAAVTQDCAGTLTRRSDTGICAELNCFRDADEDDNTVNAFLVKERFLNLHIREIRWCLGSFSRTQNTVCNEAMTDANGVVRNMTPPYGGSTQSAQRTYFEVVVEALDGDNAWTDLIDHGGNESGGTGNFRDGYFYRLNVSVEGREYNVTERFDLAATENTGNLVLSDSAHRARSEPFTLPGKAGFYNVTVKIDETRQLRRLASDTVEDKGHKTIEVAYYDFTGNFTASNFRTDSTQPYPYNDLGHIRGNVTFKNLGSAPYSNTEALGVQVYLDNTTNNGKFWHNVTVTSIGNLSSGAEDGDNALTFEIDWEYSDQQTSPVFLPPGKHTIFAKFDTSDRRLEANESNNTISLDIYVADDSKPKLLNAPKLTLLETGPNGANVTEFRPLEGISVFVNATDDDPLLTVVANFTLDSNTSVYRTFNATRIAGFTDRHVVQIRTFNYHNFTNRTADGKENWTLKVTVNDSFGNNVSSANIPFRLVPWPIHTASGHYVLVEPTWPSASLGYETTTEPRFLVRVEPNMTGFEPARGKPNQQFYTQNLGLNITTPDGETHSYNGTFFTARTSELCDTEAERPGRTTPNPTIPGVNDEEETISTCPDTEEPNNNTFLTTIAKRKPGGLGPGVWNYSVLVRDIGNNTAVINGTYHIVDEAPTVRSANLSTGASGRIEPGASFRVQANISDDDDLVAAHVNFSRALDGVYVNFTLTNGTDNPFNPRIEHRLWNDTITTGRGKMLGLGGNFTATIHAVDGAGNWNQTVIGTILIDDQDTPEIETGSFGVIPAAAEIGENVTFWAKARDSTNVSVTLRVFRAAGSDELLLERTLNESLDGNFTTTLNFTGEAIHGWELIPTDSVRNVGGKKSGIVTIRDNLGPKFEVRSPSVLIDGTRYGSATPRVEVIVYDIEGVLSSSIDMRVAGQPVNFQVLDAPGNLDGYLVSYTVPANRRFDHLDVVDVNITARDNSSEQLENRLDFSFVVDDRAPTARLLSVSPSYRDQPAHTLNVSLASRFTLAAEDIDQVPTEVASIRYRILGGGPGGPETVYSGPFRLNDAPGVYTGPRLYQVQFWAEDAVGNSGQRTANVTTVYVDDTPPTLFQFFPQPRTVNATFVDDRVGVNTSVIWLRTNDQPYLPRDLTERDGAWQGDLPAGRLGDRLCYYLQVWDKLNNTETYGSAATPYACFDVSNQEPAIRLVTPVEGARVGRTVELTWEASDPDGQALVFTVFVKKPGASTFAELRKFEDTARRAYTVDVSNSTAFPDGEYTFRVAAGDGAFVSLDDVKVILIKTTTPIGTVEVVGDAIPGESMLLKAQVTKAEAVVTARLFRGNVVVADANGQTDFPMNDEGRDGDEVAGDSIYTTRVVLPDAGDYRVEITTQYREDGVMKAETIESAATINAKLTPGYVLTKYGTIIALIGLLAAVGIGVAVFVVMRRR